MIRTLGPRSIFANRPPPLVAVDNFSVILIASWSIASAGLDFTHNLILGGEDITSLLMSRNGCAGD